MEGQLTITDYLKSQIESRKVMDFTEWINSQGKCQYYQIEDIISKFFNDEDAELIGKITNAVSVYVLEQSLAYSDYLRKESRS